MILNPAQMILICEACHRRWVPKPRQKRRKTCPKCHRLRFKAGLKRREARKSARRASTGVLPSGPPPTPAEMRKLMDEADLAAAKAFAAIARLQLK